MSKELDDMSNKNIKWLLIREHLFESEQISMKPDGVPSELSMNVDVYRDGNKTEQAQLNYDNCKLTNIYILIVVRFLLFYHLCTSNISLFYRCCCFL